MGCECFAAPLHTSSPSASFSILSVMLWPCGPGKFLYFFLFWHIIITALVFLFNTVGNSTEHKNNLKLKNVLKKEEIAFWLRCLPVHINSGQSLLPYKSLMMVFSAGRLTRHWIPHSGNVWLYDVSIIKFISLECNQASPWLIAQDSCVLRIMPVESNRLITWFTTHPKRLIDLNISYTICLSPLRRTRPTSHLCFALETILKRGGGGEGVLVSYS